MLGDGRLLGVGAEALRLAIAQANFALKGREQKRIFTGCQPRREEKRKMGTGVVCSFLLLLCLNFLFSFFLSSLSI